MRILIRTALLGAGLSVLAVAPALAQEPELLEMTSNPTSGPVGTAVTFTPTDPCPVNSEVFAEVEADLMLDSTEGPVLASDEVDGQGLWSLSYTLPEGSMGTLSFYVVCRGAFLGAGRDTSFEQPSGTSPPAPIVTLASYESVSFTVTVPTPGTTGTTAPPPPTLTAEPTTVAPGEACLLKAKGFAPGAVVTITAFSDPLVVGTVIADQLGAVSATWTVPTDFPVGNHSIVLTGSGVGGSIVSVSVGVTIASRVGAATNPTSTTTTTRASTANQSSGTLPRTGTSSTGPLVLSGAALVAAGAATVALSYRRRLAR